MSKVILPYKMPNVYNGQKEWFVQYYYWSQRQQKYLRQKVRIEQRGLSFEHRQNVLEEVARELTAELRQRNRRMQYHNEAVSSASNVLQRTLIEWFELARQDEKLEGHLQAGSGQAT